MGNNDNWKWLLLNLVLKRLIQMVKGGGVALGITGWWSMSWNSEEWTFSNHG